MRFKNLEVEKVFRKISGSFNDWFNFRSSENGLRIFVRQNEICHRDEVNLVKKRLRIFFPRFLPSLMSCRWEKRYKSQYFKKHTYKKRKSWNVSYRHTHPPLGLLLKILIFRYIHVLLALQRPIFSLFLSKFVDNLVKYFCIPI